MTDGAVVYTNRNGILTGILSIPTRYVHAPTSVFNMKDINAAVDLAVKTIEKAAKEL
jgi:endoglucanase